MLKTVNAYHSIILRTNPSLDRNEVSKDDDKLEEDEGKLLVCIGIAFTILY